MEQDSSSTFIVGMDMSNQILNYLSLTTPTCITATCTPVQCTHTVCCYNNPIGATCIMAAMSRKRDAWKYFGKEKKIIKTCSEDI